MDIVSALDGFRASGNFRRIPDTQPQGVVDLSSNDYLGLAADMSLRRELLEDALLEMPPLSSVASRLLAAEQDEYARLECYMEALYGRKALIFNSGYHANTGMIPALAGPGTLIIADKLVHASIIDGMVLSKAPFVRFRHNDYEHLEKILSTRGREYRNVLIVTESVFSMDGDYADLTRIAEIKRMHEGAVLYVDEAHAFGVEGDRGLGLSMMSPSRAEIDIIVGTFGKAVASVGAFAVMNADMRDLMVNRARSFIFSTALPPVNVAWTRKLVEKVVAMDAERARLKELGLKLNEIISGPVSGHIQPYIVGDARKAVELSVRLMDRGVKVLPIRTPTVPSGTERLRFSLSAAMTDGDIERVRNCFDEVCSIVL